MNMCPPPPPPDYRSGYGTEGLLRTLQQKQPYFQISSKYIQMLQ
jgi:hypothetical protein